MMQAQQNHQLAVTVNQSLQCVQTLLRAGFGCVTYLRGILPDENFVEGHLASSGNSSFSQPASQGSEASLERRPPPSGSLKVRTIKKGWSEEGDKLLLYLEEGIFDALEKQYLRSFIFAIYLDDEDPQNVIEAYTFNFSYHTVPGTSSKVPVMTLGEQLDKMSLEGAKFDAVTQSIIKGKAPTLGDVKQSVKTLVRTLISAVQSLNALPKRRFATFKLFYMDHVPEDYEPPHFTAGDAENKFFFTTHTKTEVPDKISIGSLKTPHHGVEMHIASVTEIIPQDGNDDNESFSGLVNCAGSTYSATQKMSFDERKRVVEIQRQDALLRKFVWDAEGYANPEGDCDAEGEYDPDYEGPYDNLLTQKLTGIRRTDGTVVETSQELEVGSMTLHGYAGAQVVEPDNIKETKNAPVLEENIPTQVVPSTPKPTPYAPPYSPLTEPPPSPRLIAQFSVEDHQESVLSRGIDTQFVHDIIEQRNLNGAPEEHFSTYTDSVRDAEMLDLETQLPANGLGQSIDDPITSFPAEGSSPHDQVMVSAIPETPPIAHKSSAEDTDLEVRDCDCGVLEDEDHGACQCEGPCGRWLHIWCMGYHSVNDPRLPHVFYCFECRLRNDPQIELLDSRNLTSVYIAKFKDLSLFRRALKIIEVHRPETVTRFKELLGSDVSTAGQAWKRLETEGFIAVRTTEKDGIGLLETQGTTSHRKGKGKQKARKNIKRPKYVPVPEAMAGKKYQDYFDHSKETSLLGMTRLRHKRTGSAKATKDSQVDFKVPVVPEREDESQTQLSTQDLQSQNLSQSSATKRKNAIDELPRTSKRMKISIGLGINLED